MADTEIHPRVLLQQGTVIGRTLTDNLPKPVDAFRGIPYALSPTGDRRFRQAVKVQPNPRAEIDASCYGPAAPGKQLIITGHGMIHSEDCLTVNVFRPVEQGISRSRSSDLLPVAIYIHGGAYNRGTAAMHNTASMVSWSERPFLAVSFNYRLGALGFLPSSVTADEDVLNLGLRDQILVLEWVRDNIKEFGGDPNLVTLVGISAGAHSIGHHLMNYKDNQAPLFHRAIIESGAPTSRAVRPFDAEIHEAQFQDLLREVNCPPETAAKDILPFLRSVSYEKITAAQTVVFTKYNASLRWAFQPVIDGKVIPRPPMESWKSGLWHKVPIMTGFTRHEGSLYLRKDLSQSSEFADFFRKLIPLDELEMSDLEDLYPDPAKHSDSPYKEKRHGAGAQFKRMEAAYANYAYQAPVRQTAMFAAEFVPTYLYQWALETSVLEGARHGDNMRYETCDPSVMTISPAQATLAKTLHTYITAFITEGDPNAAITEKDADMPLWEVYSRSKPRAMVFGLKNKELIGGESDGHGRPAEMMDDSWGRAESEYWWSKVSRSEK